jgi:hypothetical protein
MAPRASADGVEEPQLIDALDPASALGTEEVGRSGSPAGLALALVAIVLLGLGWSATKTEPTPSSTSAPTTVQQGPPTSSPAEVSAPGETTSDGNLRWPDPPEDHDPHVTGRPGAQKPLKPWFDVETLIYVNESGRPTVINLSTGDQREVVVAPNRQSDRFLVEDGRIVTDDPQQSQFPLSEGRSFEVQVYRTPLPLSTQSTAPNGPLSQSGPTLCLDTGGCEGSVRTQGGLSLRSGKALVISGGMEPAETIAKLLESDSWVTNGRWTIYSLSAPSSDDDPGEAVQIPSPMARSLVWIISQATPP